jgi:hypothetical protein
MKDDEAQQVPTTDCPEAENGRVLRAAGYCRVSTEQQVEHGHSLDGQDTRLRHYIAEQKMHCVTVYIDPGLSGRSADTRPRSAADASRRR